MTMPRHRARNATRTTYGQFIDYGEGSIMLRARNGDTWPVNSVSILSGAFGFANEGIERLPRPTKYDTNGKVALQGDIVVIDFPDGNYRLPLVRGGVRAAAREDDFFVLNQASTGADPNRIRARLRTLDADGNILGELRIQGLEDKTGSLAVKATERLQLFVGEKLGDGEAGTTITVEDGKVTLDNGSVSVVLDGALVTVATSAGASVEPVTKGTSMLNALTAVLAEVVAIGAGIPGGIAVPTPNSTSMINGISAGIYLSDTLKTE